MSENQVFQHWKFVKEADGIGYLIIDRADKAVNTISQAVIDEFNQMMDRLASETDLCGLIIKSGKPSGFVFGADIEQFTQLDNLEQAHQLLGSAQRALDRLAALPIPTVAMVKGYCLGGGYEFALGCDYIVADDAAGTKLGLPEVKLGIHPGWGGTVRLPQRMNVFSAMDVMLTGRMFSAKQAYKIGMIDAAVPERMLERAAKYMISKTPSRRQPEWWNSFFRLPFLRSWVGKLLHAKTRTKVNPEQYPAPFAMIDNWVENGAMGQRAYDRELESIAHLFMSDTARNLIRVFFLQNRLKSAAKTKQAPILHVHVIGAGVMGGDIAAWCAFCGLHVTLQDMKPELIAPAIKRAYQLYQKKCKRDRRAIEAAMDRLVPDVLGEGLSTADLVIEAISENIEIKHKVYQSIEPKMKKDAILATNTSSLPLDELNTVLKKPERLVGIHFFNPVPQMMLVEIVKGQKTSAAICERSAGFVGQIKKLPLQVKSAPGFLINRILIPSSLECAFLLEEGVQAEVIDQEAVAFGLPMGPVLLADVVGLDVMLSAAKNLSEHYGYRLPKLLEEMVAQGKLGKKSGEGFYRYQSGKPMKQTINKEAHIPGDIADRLVLRMLNEAVACYREGIIEDLELLDAGMIFGTGFAPFRGGPIQYAKTVGVDVIVQRLQALQKRHGDRFQPDAGWKQLGASTFKQTATTGASKTDGAKKTAGADVEEAAIVPEENLHPSVKSQTSKQASGHDHKRSGG